METQKRVLEKDHLLENWLCYTMLLDLLQSEPPKILFYGEFIERYSNKFLRK
jgi:hypothetical protein